MYSTFTVFFNKFFFFFYLSSFVIHLYYVLWIKKKLSTFFILHTPRSFFFVVPKRFVRSNAAILFVMIRGCDRYAWCVCTALFMLAVFEWKKKMYWVIKNIIKAFFFGRILRRNPTDGVCELVDCGCLYGCAGTTDSLLTVYCCTSSFVLLVYAALDTEIHCSNFCPLRSTILFSPLCATWNT